MKFTFRLNKRKENKIHMNFFIFSVSMAILNIVSFFVNDNIIGYINLVIGCGCFFCSGMTLQRIVYENN